MQSPSLDPSLPRRQDRSIDSPTAAWLIGHDGIKLSAVAFFDALCERLLAEGVPLMRVTSGMLTMHPQLFARTVTWDRSGRAREVLHDHGTQQSAPYLDSPIAVIHQGAAAIRRRLDIAEPQLDFPVVRDLKQQGATDYVVMPLRFSNGSVNFVSWASDRPGGFSTENLTLLWDLLPLISLRMEIESAYVMADDLLTTYLGQNAARQVLGGSIRAGQGAVIRAAIWYCDLRGFTAMADRLPPAEMIAILDDYFDGMARAVQEHGGEVLKFIGDAMLAIFEIPAGPQPSIDNAACRALNAAQAAFNALANLNHLRREDGKEALKIGVALHVGDVVYGNIGARDRLDFTVIGPAVNEVVRLERLCAEMNCPLVTSQSFQEMACDPRLQAMGWHHLRGLPEPRQVFALPAENLGMAPVILV